MSVIPRLSKGNALFFLIIAAGFIVLFNSGSAPAQECGIGIFKEAEGAGNTVFNFITEENGHQGEFSLRDGDATGGGFGPAISIVELPTPGWHLDDVVCDTEGLTITDIPGGVLVECTGPNGGSGSCTFINLRGGPTSNIPTLSEWGMIAAAAGLGLVGVFFAIRRKKAQVV